MDERECRDILTAVRNFGQLALEITDIELEVVALCHFDSEEVVVLLGFPARGVVSKEHFSYLLEIVKRMWGQGVKPIRGYAY